MESEEVRAQQLSRLATLKANRDASRVEAALGALSSAAQAGTGNLLALAIEAMRARATLGEVSQALAKTFGRYQGQAQTVRGVYGSYYTGDPRWEALKAKVQHFLDTHGRRPRLLVAKVGQDGHDRGAKLVASGFADLGFDVDVGPLFQTPAEVARQAIENDAHVVGISTQAGAHRTLVPELCDALAAQGASNIIVVCGGIIPPADVPALEARGVRAVFGPGTPVPDAAERVLELLAGAAGKPTP